jgi:hypothetical protein
MNQSALSLSFLEHSRNSCYMDVVIVSLFLFPTDYIKKEMLEKNLFSISFHPSKKPEVICDEDPRVDYFKRVRIQNELRFLSHYLSRPNFLLTCEDLRNALSVCRESFEKFASSRMQDASEFFMYLISLFELDPSPVVIVSADMLPTSAQRVVNKYGPISLPFVAFYVPNRLDNSPFYCEDQIRLKNRSILTLLSVIIFRPRHYTCYVRDPVSSNWLYYDDLVGKYIPLLNHNKRFPNPFKEGTLYLYGKT